VSTILDKLKAKHTDDVFVAECKNGPTHTASHRRLDAWVMKKSWSPITMLGYEIKQSRSDFLQDNKWQAYLPCCHQLYFVCPKGIIQPEELPQDVGLLWAGEGERLFTKRKAPYRAIELPAELLVYVLMCRTQVTRECVSQKEYRDYWVDWLKQKNEDRELGYHVKQAIRNRVHTAEVSVIEATRKVDAYSHLREELKKHGVDPDNTWSIHNFERELGDMLSGGLQKLNRNLATLERTMEMVRSEVDELVKGKAA